MAVVQISKIQIRRGQKNTSSGLPQLASGELAWAIDTQELYIGNGAVSEGAPYVGNTKIITEQDNLLELVGSYQFAKNNPAIQTGPNANQPVLQNLQDVIDQFVTASNFGVVGDGVEDDTAAIQRAIDQLFLNPSFQGIPANPGAREEARVELQFGSGIFRITSTIYLPSYVGITGSGFQKTIFRYEGDEVAFKFVNTDSTIGEYTTANMTPTNQPKYVYLRDFTILCASSLASGMELNCVTNSKFLNISLLGSYPWDGLDYTIEPPSPNTPILKTGIVLQGGLFPNAETTVTHLRVSGGAPTQFIMILDSVSGLSNGARVLGTGVPSSTIVTNINQVTNQITLSNAFDAQSSGTYTFIIPADTIPTTKSNLFDKIQISGFAVCLRGEQNVAYNNFTNCEFTNSFYGAYFGYLSGGPVNNTISESTFRQINKQGIYLEDGTGNASINNKFEDVGADGGHFNVNITSIIYFGSPGNHTIGDIFDRGDLATKYLNNDYAPEVEGISYFVNSSPQQITQVSQALSEPIELFRIPVTSSGNYTVEYKYLSNNNAHPEQYRNGIMSITVDLENGFFEFVDDYSILSENVANDTALVFSAALVDNTVVVKYLNSKSGTGTFTFIIKALT